MEFAVKHKGHTHFGMLMAAYTGAEPDFKLWLRRNVLKNFSLEPVGAPAVED